MGKVPDRNSDPSRTTWDAATCNFEANGYRLPTEAEWEWLARGGDNYEYAGSDNVDDVAWYLYGYAGSDYVDDVVLYINKNDTGTREVKTKAPNGYGLYDMSGNVCELCWDWYGSISSSSAADGATSGDYRVVRGGSWDYKDDYCQVAYPRQMPPFYRYYPMYGGIYFYGQGFRVVRQAN